MTKVNKFTPDAPTSKEADDMTDSFKRGGRKKNHAVDGDKPKVRLDRRARGGHSPLTAAAKVQGRPGGKYDGEGSLDKSDD